MKLLSSQDLIEKQGCLLEASRTKDNVTQAKVVCIGKENWDVLLPSCFGGWAMLFENLLIDLSRKFVLHTQGNEHSRGAHVIFENVILDLKGKTVHSWSSYSHTTFLVDQTSLYYLKEKQRDSRNYGDRKFLFCKTKLKTLASKEYVLDFPTLLGDPKPLVLTRKLITKHDAGFLEITYVGSQQDGRQKKRIPISKSGRI